MLQPVPLHPITAESFDIIDREIAQTVGVTAFSPDEYAIVRRAIHSTADFALLSEFRFSPNAIAAGIAAVQAHQPIITDVQMVAVGIRGVLRQAGLRAPICAIDLAGSNDVAAASRSQQVTWTKTPVSQIQANEIQADEIQADEIRASQAPATETRSARGMRAAIAQCPTGIFAIGNAPTALFCLIEAIQSGAAQPALVIGAPVGFVAVEASKQALAAVDVPQIVVQGRKGGSPIAAAIVNAIVSLAAAPTAEVN